LSDTVEHRCWKDPIIVDDDRITRNRSVFENMGHGLHVVSSADDESNSNSNHITDRFEILTGSALEK